MRAMSVDDKSPIHSSRPIRSGRSAIQEWINGSGIDIDIPTEPTHSKCSPDGVRDAVLAAFHGNDDDVILSRKYSWMKLTDLQGTRTTLQPHLSAKLINTR
jgi:hypothetical protein